MSFINFLIIKGKLYFYIDYLKTKLAITRNFSKKKKKKKRT